MFHFQCMINNYSFLPIMLAATLLDEKGVAQIIFSALGAELVVRSSPAGADGWQ